MGDYRKILIITDDTAPIQQMARDIAAVFGEYPGYQAEIVLAGDFSGEKLLPSHAFFLGCGSPKPASFSVIHEMLEHINLAGRPCGVFSSNLKALKYLSALVRSSEAAAGKPLLVKNGPPVGELKKWIQSIVVEEK